MKDTMLLIFGFLILILIFPGGLFIDAYLSGDWHPTKKLYEYTTPICPEGFEKFYYNHGTRCRKKLTE